MSRHGNLYGARWRKFRRAFLIANPLCEMCKAQGKTTAAVVCDHVEPHRGDPVKFWSGPFQALCESCHNGAKQQQEKTGTLRGSTADGRPVDPNHHWNR